jgi:excisionase family DNA binding protein
MQIDPPVDKQQSILKLANVAEYLRVHPSTIYRLLKKKQLPAFKIGRDWRFNKESIDRWFSSTAMPKKGHSTKGHEEEEEVLRALRQVESGTGVSEKSASQRLDESRELQELREENNKLKRLVVDRSVQRHSLHGTKKDR